MSSTTFRKSTIKLVLVRHGESVWNKENRFTGWTDVELSEKGVSEAKQAGKMLMDAKLDFDLCYTSVLKRAIKTWWLATEQMDRSWLPVKRSWRLNERHYGNLQGLNKIEMVEKFGEQQVHIWRRSYDIQPPPLDSNDPRHPKFDLRYKDLTTQELPLSECLKDTVNRFMPFWTQEISQQLKAGTKVAIFAHGNSIRAMIKLIEGISDQEIVEVNVPTGIPLVYELDESLNFVSKQYLADEATLKAAIHSVAMQSKKN
jgi:2,3-bisphosphoglycerate-dependent phosphoglycerate mutase